MAVGPFERGGMLLASEQALSEAVSDADPDTGWLHGKTAENVLAAGLEALARYLPRGVVLSADDLHTLARDLET